MIFIFEDQHKIITLDKKNIFKIYFNKAAQKYNEKSVYSQAYSISAQILRII